MFDVDPTIPILGQQVEDTEPPKPEPPPLRLFKLTRFESPSQRLVTRNILAAYFLTEGPTVRFFEQVVLRHPQTGQWAFVDYCRFACYGWADVEEITVEASETVQ